MSLSLKRIARGIVFALTLASLGFLGVRYLQSRGSLPGTWPSLAEMRCRFDQGADAAFHDGRCLDAAASAAARAAADWDVFVASCLRQGLFVAAPRRQCLTAAEIGVIGRQNAERADAECRSQGNALVTIPGMVYTQCVPSGVKAVMDARAAEEKAFAVAKEACERGAGLYAGGMDREARCAGESELEHCRAEGGHWWAEYPFHCYTPAQVRACETNGGRWHAEGEGPSVDPCIPASVWQPCVAKRGTLRATNPMIRRPGVAQLRCVSPAPDAGATCTDNGQCRSGHCIWRGPRPPVGERPPGRLAGTCDAELGGDGAVCGFHLDGGVAVPVPCA